MNYLFSKPIIGMGSVSGGSPAWDKLYANGRCKYHGVAWSNEELKLIQLAEKEGGEDKKREVIKALREKYMDANKDSILDPLKGKRAKSAERKKLDEEYELVFGKKPHHFANDETIKRKLAEAKENQEE